MERVKNDGPWLARVLADAKAAKQAWPEWAKGNERIKDMTTPNKEITPEMLVSAQRTIDTVIACNLETVDFEPKFAQALIDAARRGLEADKSGLNEILWKLADCQDELSKLQGACQRGTSVTATELAMLTTENQLLRQQLDELRKDKERLDWIQKGHCILCLCVFKKKVKTGYEFEIDGHQMAPRHSDVRKALDMAIDEDQAIDAAREGGEK